MDFRIVLFYTHRCQLVTRTSYTFFNLRRKNVGCCYHKLTCYLSKFVYCVSMLKVSPMLITTNQNELEKKRRNWNLYLGPRGFGMIS